MRGLGDTESTISELNQQISDIGTTSGRSESLRSELVRTLDATSSEDDQLKRMAADIRDQIERVTATLGIATTLAEIDTNKAESVNIEQQMQVLERTNVQTQSSLSDLDRAIAEKLMDIAGIERRKQVVEAFLTSFDAEIGWRPEVLVAANNVCRHAKRRCYEPRSSKRSKCSNTAITMARERLPLLRNTGVTNSHSGSSNSGARSSTCRSRSLQNDSAETY